MFEDVYDTNETDFIAYLLNNKETIMAQVNVDVCNLSNERDVDIMQIEVY